MVFLITGASGFIGSKLVNALLERGDSVNYLARKRSGKIDSRAAFHSWDGVGLPPLDSVPRLDAILHLMGETVAQRWTPAAKERIRRSRVSSTRQLVSAVGALRHKPRMLISASAVGYYGDRGNEVLTEESAAGRGFLADLCVEWEHEARRASEFGLRVANIRIATVLGRDGGALAKMLLPFRLGVGGRFGSGQQWMSWVHVEDLVRLFLFAADTDVNGPLNGSSPQPVTNVEFTSALAKAVHRPAVLPIPRFALNAVLGEMSGFLFDSIRALPAAAESAGFRFEHADLGGTLKQLIK
jgi:uncharacterized protein (TIGR01777 family)